MSEVTETDVKDLFGAAIYVYGKENQIVKAMEEAAEFTQSLSKKFIDPELNNNQLVSEIADLEIMIGQVKYIYGIKNELVDSERHFKLQRLLVVLKQKDPLLKLPETTLQAFQFGYAKTSPRP